MLKAVAGSLTESVGSHTVARWGGEAFLIIFDGIAVTDALVILERVRKDLEARSFKIRNSDETIGTITISVGLASLTGLKRDDAIDLADAMLYKAKHEGRNRIVTQL